MIILIIDNPIRSGAVPNIWSVQLSQRPCSKSAQMCTIQNPFYDQCSFFLKKCLQQMVACTKRRETLQPTRKKPSKLKKKPFEPFNFFCNEWWQGQIKCTGNIPISYGFKILIMVHKGWIYHSFQQRGIVHQANCFLFTQAP